MIRILIVDAHPVFRAGLTNLLKSEPDFLVVGEAGNGHAAVRLWEQHQPHILLLDLSMPGISGLETLRRIRMMAPDAKAIMLTSSESADDADLAQQAGARGYLTKHVDQEELVAAIRRVNAGQVIVQPGLVASPATVAHACPAGVSSREMEVLVFLRQGFSNAQIGRTLGITERTVKAHVGALMKKLHAADRAEVVARGFDLGMLKVAHGLESR